MNSTRCLWLTTFVFTLFASAQAEAQCLSDSDRAAFETELRARLSQSDLSTADLYRLAQDKLGFGLNPDGALATPPAGSRAFQIDLLVTRIADSLEGAAAIRRPIELELAKIERAPVPTDNPELPLERYRHAATTMTDAYSELIEAQTALTAAKKRYDALPPGAAKDAALAEYQRVQRWRVRVNGDLQATAPARLLAVATLGSNVDLGATLNEFWSNHFNIEVKKTTWATVDYRKMLQRRQCSTFRGILFGSAKHPGMQIYLDNFRSKKGAINENYGRELLELHTFGDDLQRYYNQADVVDAARVLTGWSIQFTKNADGTTTPSFGFYPSTHDGAAVTMFDTAALGTRLTIPAGSGDTAVSRGEALLTYLSAHPQVRRNICSKLARWIIGRAQPETVEGCIADAVWGTDGNLGAIYRFLLTRRELWQSVGGLDMAQAAALPRLYGAVQKTPIELVVSTARAVGTPSQTVLTNAYLNNAIEASSGLGIRPAGVAPPTGYPIGATWLSAGLLIRLQQHVFKNIATDRVGVPINRVLVRGDALEARMQARVETAGSDNLALTGIAEDVLRNGLMAPPSIAIPLAAQLGALTKADSAKATGAKAPVRTITQAYLGSARFTRK